MIVVDASVVVASLLSTAGAGARARERLAEALNTPLVTSDQRLARAPGLACQVEVLLD